MKSNKKKHKLSKNTVDICVFAFFMAISISVLVFIYLKHEKGKDAVRYEITVIDKYMEIDSLYPERSKFYITYKYKHVNSKADMPYDTITELVTRDTYRSHRTEIGKRYYKIHHISF